MAIRDSWLEKREKDAAAANGNRNMSQMHFARQGVITEEMRFVAGREKIEPELVRSEIARGRMIIPANVNHRNLEPMGIGIASKCKINANIGNSATSSNIDEELKKLHHAVHYGADTVMDLSTGGDIPVIRKAIIEASPVPVGTVPVYEAISRVRRPEDLTIDLMLEVIEEQAEQGVDYMTIHAGRVARACAAGAEADYGNCQPRRILDGALDGASQEAKFPVRKHREDLQDFQKARRQLFVWRRIAAGVHRGRQRRSAVRGVEGTRRTHDRKPGSTTYR